MPVFVHVAGAVLSSGVVELPAGSRVVDAVAAAGGLRPDADSNRVNLAATLLDGSQVMIPSVGQANPEQVPVTQGSAVAGTSASNGSSPVADLGPINLNTATLEQLDALPGVGPATAQAILAFRDKEGRFDSVEALLDVRGIGDAKFEALRELVTV
jgi:competence protein ComEA